MRRQSLAVLIWLIVTGTAAAAPRIALVRIGEIYRVLPATQALNAGIEADRSRIMTDPRADAFRAAMQELEERRHDMTKIPKDDRATLLQAQRDHAIRRQEALTLQREFQAFHKRRNQEIHSWMVAEMEKILADIQRKAAEIGRLRGYDWVLDADGQTNTGLSFVLYSKKPDDITADVLAALGVPPTSQEESATQ